MLTTIATFVYGTLYRLWFRVKIIYNGKLNKSTDKHAIFTNQSYQFDVGTNTEPSLRNETKQNNNTETFSNPSKHANVQQQQVW